MSKIAELKDFYAGCLMAEAGEHIFHYTDDTAQEVVLEYNKIYSEIRNSKKLTAKLNQGSNTITFIVKDHLPVDKVIMPHTEEVEMIDLGFSEDCKTPEGCEDGCKDDCKEGFDGENLT